MVFRPSSSYWERVVFKVLCQPRPVHELHIWNTILWKASAPFYQNLRGVLTHRVKSARTHLNDNGTIRHFTVEYWCGNWARGPHGEFLDLRDGDISKVVLCEFCELKATRSGEPSSDELALRHVHRGRAKAIRSCCNE